MTEQNADFLLVCLKQFIVWLFVDFISHLYVDMFVGVLGLHALFSKCYISVFVSS